MTKSRNVIFRFQERKISENHDSENVIILNTSRIYAMQIIFMNAIIVERKWHMCYIM